MSFNRDALPEPIGYFDRLELALRGPGKWKTTRCEFHGGSDSMRVNTASGAWVCMACGVKGGDVLAYEMRLTGAEFEQAAKNLGAWIDDGREPIKTKPSTLPPRAALEVLNFEATLIAVAAGNIAKGLALNAADLKRITLAAGRIRGIAEEYAT